MKQQSLDLEFQNYIEMQDMQSCSFFEEIHERVNNFLSSNELSLVFFGKEDLAKSFFFFALHNLLSKKFNCLYHSSKEKNDFLFLKNTKTEIIFLDSYNNLFGFEEGEKKLFDLFNLSKEQKIKLIFNNSIEKSQKIDLKDLESRLSSSLQLNFPDLSDEDKKIIVLNFMKKRGLILNNRSIDFIINRYSRSLNDLIELSYKLDKISLIEKKNITIPLIKKFINL
jgi:chromosomal replication initiation ATPase DnaA